MSIESVMPSIHLILCHPLLLPPSIFPSIRVFSNGSALHIRWPKYWSVSFSISPSNEYSGLISFRMNWFDFFAVQGTLCWCRSPTPQFKSIDSSALSFLYSPTLTPIHDYTSLRLRGDKACVMVSNMQELFFICITQNNFDSESVQQDLGEAQLSPRDPKPGAQPLQ